jgi:hypothetical protein
VHRDYLVRDHMELVTRLTVLGQRARRVAANLRDRPNPADDGARLLRAELVRVREQMAPLTARLRPILVGLGVPDEAFARAERGPRGALREERHAHALVLEAPGASPAAQALLARLVPAADGALLALHAEGEATEPRRKALEKRFWRVVDAVLDAPAKRWVRSLLPSKKAEYDDVIGHVYRVSGLTASQGAQLKALLVELDAESAPDVAAVRAAESRAGAPDVTDSERADLERVKTETGRRLVAMRIDAYERGMRILTPEQADELKAIPPDQTAADRQTNPKDVVEQVELTAEQRERLAALAQRYEGEKKRVEQEVLRVALQQKELGPDSPRQDEMAMEYVGIQNRVQHVVQAAAREILLDVLTPEQVLLWVLGAGTPRAADGGLPSGG